MCRNTLALVASLTLAACQPGNSGGDAGDPPPSPPPSGDDGDGDGDGDPDDGGRDDEGDAQPVCDISQFPLLVPEWIVEAESPIEGAIPSVSALEVTADSIFAAGRHDISDAEPPGFVERRNLTGELEWSTDVRKARGPFRIEWDGDHLYVSLGYEVRRWTGDGGEDGWSFDAEFIADMDVRGDSVAIVGSYTERGGHPDYTDAYYGILTKKIPPQYSGSIHVTTEGDDHGQQVLPSPWGGWIAAGTSGDPASVWLEGFAGGQFSAALNFGRSYPHVHAMAGSDDKLLVLGRTSPSGIWLSALASTGEEIWRKEIALCEEIIGSLRHLIEWKGTLWSLGTVRTDSQTFAPLLVQLDYEGAVLKTLTLHSNQPHATLSTLRIIESGFYVGGYSHDGSKGFRTIGKVRP